MTDERPVLLGFRDATRHPGHKEIQVFAGRNVGSRGNCGTITVRDDEWPTMRGALLRAGFDEMPTIAKWPVPCQNPQCGKPESDTMHRMDWDGLCSGCGRSGYNYHIHHEFVAP